jgi:hypothetical protein
MTRTIKILIGIVILGVVCFFGYKNFLTWHKERLEKALKQEQQFWQSKTNTLEAEIKDLQTELEQVKGTGIPKEKVVEIFGKEPEKVRQKTKPLSFEAVEIRIASFFAYLDKQDYIVSYGLKEGTHQEFQKGVVLLSANPPIIAGEMDSLYRLLQNIAHLFRTLGKDRVNLGVDVLKNESDIIESVMKTFYLWFTFEGEFKPKIRGRPSLKVLYEYSGFFLTTFAGRSYLIRRDPKVRTLAYYYCVLILDKANDVKLNTYGLDIRPHIKQSYEEIRTHMGLFDQKEYLLKLRSLVKKYKIS